MSLIKKLRKLRTSRNRNHWVILFMYRVDHLLIQMFAEIAKLLCKYNKLISKLLSTSF